MNWADEALTAISPTSSKDQVRLKKLRPYRQLIENRRKAIQICDDLF